MIMKKIIFLFAVVALIGTAQAQTKKNYLIKGEYLRGTILKHNEHLKNLVKGPSVGIELALEYRTAGEKDWHHFLNFPTVGFGLNYMNLSNPDTLGYSTSIYPYLNIPIVQTKYFMLNVKAGGGLAYVNKTFKDTYDPSVGINFNNGAIGSHLNVFLAGGLNIEIPLFEGLSLTADYAWNHISNGSIVQPNSGINMLNAYVGLKVFPNFAVYTPPVKENKPDISRQINYEATLSGGVRELYYRDEGKKYPIASFSLAAYRPMANWYRMGVGVDVFYDGVFGAVNSTDAGNTTDTDFKKTYITKKKSANLFRAGVSWHHELMLGRLTAGFHLGLYLYDPIKNLEPFNDAKDGNVRKGLIYSYNIDVEDGWFYTKAVAKYRITKHLFASVGLKTHLQKAEFIEWGIGYRL
jgi:hypothetical protein